MERSIALMREFIPFQRLFAFIVVLSLAGCTESSDKASSSQADDALPWESSNPLIPIPDPPLGIGTDEIYAKLTDFPDPPTPERVRLGRWLFYDTRLSADNTVSCATCHRPENAFSEPTPVSTGIDGQKGGRKAPSFTNQAWTLFPHFFWDGRSHSLEDQAGGPMINPIEMGTQTHDEVVERLGGIEGYAQYFEEAYGSQEVTIERVTKAIADYERTRMSGNSPWDQWRKSQYTEGEESVVSDEVKLGNDLFFGRARCNNCHLGQNFTDSDFHNLGVGWDPDTQTLNDDGRYAVTKEEKDRGAFKTPSLRDISKHAPFMHDGSFATLKEVVEHYNIGGTPNPYLDDKVDFEKSDKLDLSEEEINALVKFMEALDGQGYQDTIPEAFPS
jgi:cytochrome c peroxidase